MKKENFWISCYPNKFDLNRMTKVPLEWFLCTDMFKDKVEKVRQYEYHTQEYNDAKETAGVIATINGVIESGKSKTKDNIEINPTICVDIDMQDNKELFDKYSIEEIKYGICEIPSCMYVCKSIGGYGLMVIHRLSDKVNKDNYKDYFDEIQDLYKSNGIYIDQSCSNVNRLRYCTYDDFVIKNEIYEPYELKKSHKKKIDTSSSKIHIDIKSSLYDLSKSKGPFYFGHSERHHGCPLIKEVMHTLLCFFPKEEVKDIWRHPKFYCPDNVKWSEKIYRDNIRWTDAWILREKMIPSKSVIKFLNENCGFNLECNIHKDGVVNIETMTEDMISSFTTDKVEIEMLPDKWLYDYKDDIINNLKYGINEVIAPTGQGKTTFWDRLYKEDNKRILVVEPYSSIVETKYDKEITHIAAGLGKYIDPMKDYVATNYLKFCKSVREDTIPQYDFLVVDESHLIGTQSFRSESLIDFINQIKNYLKKYPNSYVVFQTATPANEEYFFDISRKIEIKKDIKKFVQIQYTYSLVKKDKLIHDDTANELCEDYSYNIEKTILYYTNIYLNEKRKVYVYWGSGSISIMKRYQQCEHLMSQIKCAVYHKKNDNDESMKYISDNHRMGIYDVMMSSCYFSVGCDLDDECNAAIIIVGNNPYQEDEQVIGRFRKSKNIVVNILVDKNTYIKKKDVSNLLELRRLSGQLKNRTKEHREKSLIKRYSEEENIEMKAYMECSNDYYSDLKRKFDFYENKKYHIVNKLNIYTENNKTYYDILNITKEGYKTVVNLIDFEDTTLEDVIKSNKEYVKHSIERIWNELVKDHYYDVSELFESSKDKPTLLNWIKSIYLVQKHYDIDRLIENVDKKSILKMRRNKMTDLIKMTINIKNKETDFIEHEIINKLCKIYDKLKDKEEINIYLILFYCYWCKYSENKKGFTYDMYKNMLSYPVFKEWNDRIFNIISVNKDIRDYFLNYHKAKTSIIDENSPSYQFLKDIIDSDEQEEVNIEVFKNKFIHDEKLKQFIEYQIGCLHDYKNIRKGVGKIGGQKGRIIEIDGQTYNTIKEAAEALKTSRSQIYRLITKS